MEDLFKDVTLSPLLVIRHDKVEAMGVREIFDATSFDELYAVSYVSNAKFFSTVVNGFNNVTFILGIPDSEHKGKFKAELASCHVDMLLLKPKERLAFWNAMSEDVKTACTNGSISIRYAPHTMLIHDKIYLLSHSKTGACRVVLGSANLSEAAFSHPHHYETLYVWDNNTVLFSILKQRIDYFYEKSFDFIPDRCKKEGHNQSLYIDINENSADILIEELAKIKKLSLPADIKDRLIEKIEEREKEKEDYKNTEEVIKICFRKKGDTLIPKTEAGLKEHRSAIRTLVAKTSAHTETTDKRKKRFDSLTHMLL